MLPRAARATLLIALCREAPEQLETANTYPSRIQCQSNGVVRSCSASIAVRAMRQASCNSPPLMNSLAFLVLVLSVACRAAPLTPDNDAYNVNRETTPGVWRGEWPEHQYFPSPADWRAVPIYQVNTIFSFTALCVIVVCNCKFSLCFGSRLCEIS